MALTPRRFDIYRELYPTMTVKERELWHSLLWDDEPNQDHFNEDAAVAFGRSLPVDAKVLEYGGWTGDMAYMLLDEHEIAQWWNVECCKQARESGIQHERYMASARSPLPLLDSLNGFVASHVLEHMDEIEIRGLIEEVTTRLKVPVILLDFPEPHEVDGTTALHITGDVWSVIEQYMAEYKMEQYGTAMVFTL